MLRIGIGKAGGWAGKTEGDISMGGGRDAGTRLWNSSAEEHTICHLFIIRNIIYHMSITKLVALYIREKVLVNILVCVCVYLPVGVCVFV